MTRYQGLSCGESKHKVPTKYITFIKDMYHNVQVIGQVVMIDTFPITIGLHQGAALSS
jgi:hypothetical protein